MPDTLSTALSSSQTVSWIHIGDPHLTRSGEQNELDLGRIVDEINETHAARGIDFVYIPGDIADDGSATAFQAFRRHLDRLRLPWFGIVGDHDVHERSFDNFHRYIAPTLYSAFSIGLYRFLRLNAFSRAAPDSFTLDTPQLAWLESELRQCANAGQSAVLFLHCYPSDLRQGGPELAGLLRRYPVLLVDMGHTHFNELANDGHVLYSATRSTGQVEEGPVGYSLTTLDRGCVSWHFVPLGAPSLLAITQPADERLTTERAGLPLRPGRIAIHARAWSASPVAGVHASLAHLSTGLTSADGLLWQGELDASSLPAGAHTLRILAHTRSGGELSDTLQLRLGPAPPRTIHPVDQDNALGAWPERALLGTRLGPNKNGRKW